MQRSVQGRSVTVVGLDAAGIAAARLARRKGARSVVVQDPRDAADGNADDLLTLARDDIRIELGVRRWNTLTSSDLVVAAPCALGLPGLELAASLGVALVSEVELASWYLESTLVVVTGTFGRRSCAALVGAMLRAAGRRVFVGDGVHAPLSSVVDTAATAVGTSAVLALSPAVLAWTHSLRPAVTIVPTLDDVAPLEPAMMAALQRAWLAQGRGGHVLMPERSLLGLSLARAGAGTVYPHSADKCPARWEQGALLVQGERFAAEQVKLRDALFAPVVASAALAAKLLGVDHAALAKALASFGGLPHRSELVLEDDGIRYIDDGHATRLGATTGLLARLDRSAVVIVGPLTPSPAIPALCAALEKRARAVVLAGPVHREVRRALGRAVPIREAGDLFDAVSTARNLARRGDAVVFSPGCFPGELADDPEEAGRLFASAVRALAGTPREEDEAEFEVDLDEGG